MCVCTNARLTHANNPLNVNTANINLLGKLVDGLIGVFIGERVHVDFNSCRGREAGEDRKRGRRRKRDAEESEEYELYNCCICYVNVFGSMCTRRVQVDRREEKEKDHSSVFFLQRSMCVCVCVCSTWVQMLLLL